MLINTNWVWMVFHIGNKVLNLKVTRYASRHVDIKLFIEADWVSVPFAWDSIRHIFHNLLDNSASEWYLDGFQFFATTITLQWISLLISGHTGRDFYKTGVVSRSVHHAFEFAIHTAKFSYKVINWFIHTLRITISQIP